MRGAPARPERHDRAMQGGLPVTRSHADNSEQPLHSANDLCLQASHLRQALEAREADVAQLRKQLQELSHSHNHTLAVSKDGQFESSGSLARSADGNGIKDAEPMCVGP